jgi:hypothetical protein
VTCKAPKKIKKGKKKIKITCSVTLAARSATTARFVRNHRVVRTVRARNGRIAARGLRRGRYTVLLTRGQKVVGRTTVRVR